MSTFLGPFSFLLSAPTLVVYEMELGVFQKTNENEF